MKRKIISVILCALMLMNFTFLTGCDTANGNGTVEGSLPQGESELYKNGDDFTISGSESESDAFAQKPVPKSLSTWITYWDIEDVTSELNTLSEDLEAVSFFEIFYDENLEFIVPNTMDKLHSAFDRANLDVSTDRYLTFVNDLRYEDGKTSLKNTDILKKLFETDEKSQAHADRIVELTKAGDYTGIEIDYEAIKKDIQLWEQFIKFTGYLKKAADKEKLKLRVVLEPNVPYSQLSFVDGIEYVVMCYNYKGEYSEAGPKATPSFLEELVTKTNSLPGDPIYAVAAGGFDWTEPKKAVSITEKKAKELAETHNITPKRDSESGALYFSYPDENSKTHEVWYADNATLSLWIKTLQDVDITKLALWRVGGNYDLDEINFTVLSTPFKDISNHWAKDAIKWVYNQKLFSGVTNTKFMPNDPMTRAMLAAVLHRLALEPETEYYPYFTDVPDETYYSEPVTWAVENQIVAGVGDDLFAPNMNVSREQIAAMLFRYAELFGGDNGGRASLDRFTDAEQISTWAEEALKWAVYEGIISGKTTTTIEPQAKATRAEVASTLMRYAQKNDNA